MARLTVLGQSGTGKSWATGELIERILDPEHPNHPGESFDIAFHFDPEDEERGLSDEEHDPLFYRLDVDVQMASRIDWMKVAFNHRRVRIVPDMKPEHQRRLFGEICGALFELVKDVRPELTGLLSCDEAGGIVTQNGADKRALEVQTRGRKYGLETIHSCQRPQQLHTTVISQSDRRFYFRINDDNDLDKLQGQTGFNVYRISDMDGRGLSDLEDREVVIENVDTGEFVVQITDNWTRLRPHHADDDGVIDEALPV
jgi:hypothetical protein